MFPSDHRRSRGWTARWRCQSAGDSLGFHGSPADPKFEPEDAYKWRRVLKKRKYSCRREERKEVRRKRGSDVENRQIVKCHVTDSLFSPDVDPDTRDYMIFNELLTAFGYSPQTIICIQFLPFIRLQIFTWLHLNQRLRKLSNFASCDIVLGCCGRMWVILGLIYEEYLRVLYYVNREY